MGKVVRAFTSLMVTLNNGLSNFPCPSTSRWATLTETVVATVSGKTKSWPRGRGTPVQASSFVPHNRYPPHSTSSIPTRNKVIFQRKHRFSPTCADLRACPMPRSPPPADALHAMPYRGELNQLKASEPAYHLRTQVSCHKGTRPEKEQLFHFREGFTCEATHADILPATA